MDRLSGVEELLDGPLDAPRVLAGNLRDLRRVNRWLGGVDLSWRAIERLDEAVGTAPAHPVDREASAGPRGASTGPRSLLDVGTGAADIPLALMERARDRGRPLRVVGLDSRPEVLAAAAILDPALTARDGLELHVGDGRTLPFDDRAFDIAHSSMVIHHLEPADAVALLREMARVARQGVIVNDLARSRPAFVGAWLLAHLATRNRFTRNDGPLSVRRAYTPDELAVLLERAGLVVVARIRGPFGHRWALVGRMP